MQPLRTPLPLGRMFLVGAIVPALFAWIDYHLRSGDAIDPIVYGVYVVQIGALGILTSWLIENPVVRRIIYCWGWLFIDLHAIVDAADTVIGWQSTSIDLLEASLFAAQIGLLSVWAVLGRHPHWAARWSVAIVGTILLSVPFLDDEGGWRFAVQCVAMLAICTALFFKGYRLYLIRATSKNTAERSGVADELRVQFGVRHVLIWTTTVAVSLAVLRGLDLLSWESFPSLFDYGWMSAITGGGIVAIVLIVALWAALGEGPFWVRWPAPFLAAVVGGFALHTIEWIKAWPPPKTEIDAYREYEFFYGQYDPWAAFTDIGWTRITWVCLAGGLVFAGLLYFRTQGVRLGHKIKLKRVIQP